MQNMILLLFALFFTAGLYLISAELLSVPTYKATKAILSLGKRERKKARDSDAFIMELAVKLSKVLPMDEYRKRKLTAVLKSAEIPMTAEVYAAQAIVKAGLILLCVVPCLLVVPILSPAFIIIGIAVYFAENGKAEKLITARRQHIEYELPRFVATLVQGLKASRDVLSILESYQKNAGKAMKNELSITTSDMRTGNYEGALTRFEARVSSAMLSDVVRGLIGVLRGDDGVTFFQMLSHDMKQLELQRLKRLAMERPPKIRKFSFLLLGCMLLLYMGVMGYQILGAMSGMF
ncbi:MAG: secretion protein F [Oscillospiraceae bacterium]|nr:secretion protein F [Oscillospiraceae bacterium]